MKADPSKPHQETRDHTPPPPTPTPAFLLTRFPDRDPPRTHAKVRYLLNAWHSTTSASAEGVAFMEEDSHKRAAVGDG